MKHVVLATTAGVVCVTGGVFLAASLIWSPLAGVASVLILGGAPLIWFGLTHDVKE